MENQYAVMDGIWRWGYLEPGKFTNNAGPVRTEDPVME